MKRAVLVLGNNHLLQDIKAILPLTDYSAVANTDNGLEALRLIHRFEPDLAIMGWDTHGLRADELLETLIQQHLCPVIVVLNQGESNKIPQIVTANAHQIVLYPLRAIDFWSAIQLAEQRFIQEKEQEDKYKRLEEELKTRKIIYQAIIKIVQLRGFDEENAYRLLRQQAMNSRKTIRYVAREILKGKWLPD